jgi:hypothetical protein
MSTHTNGLGAWARFALVSIAMAAGAALVAGQGITIPNTFVNGTTADANQVNANFAALAASAVNRNAGTMIGTLNVRDLIPTSDNSYDLGSSSFQFRDAYVKRNLLVPGTTTFNAQTYTWPGSHGAAGTVLAENGSGALAWQVLSLSDLGTCDLRLTLTSGTPITTADVTGATAVYVSPLKGGRCAFYDGATTWTVLTNAEQTISVAATTNTLYDVWCRNNGGTIACDTTAWTNDTTRATALTTQNAVLVKTGDTTRRYIGTFRTTSSSGQTVDSLAQRYVWSYYNRQPRPLRVIDAADSWNYTTATFRQMDAGAGTADQLDVVIGVAEVPIEVQVVMHWANSGAQATVYASIGEDSTSTPVAGVLAQASTHVSATAGILAVGATLRKFPAVGRHTYVPLEYSTAVGTTTWYGDNGGTLLQSGIHGVIQG